MAEEQQQVKHDLKVPDSVRARLSQAVLIRLMGDMLLFSAAAYGTELYVLTMGLHMALRDPELFHKLVNATKDIIQAQGEDETLQRMFGNEEWSKTN
jgi:hypothetical protein